MVGEQRSKICNSAGLDGTIQSALDGILYALGYEGPRPLRRYMCRCPLHDDRRPSLSIAATPDGKILMHCFAGCQTSAILATVGLSVRHLFAHIHHESQLKFPFYDAICVRTSHHARAWSVSAPKAQEPLGKIVARYIYFDANGNPFCQVARFEPKNFRALRYVNGQWRWGLDGVRPPLYRLPELLAAGPDEWVFLVEGEKDVEALYGHGLIATCNIGGAGKWKPEYTQWLANRRVCILPDNDEPGRRHAGSVAKQLAGVARLVQILEVPGLPEKGDVSDWIGMGGDGEKLLTLLSQRKPPY